jgi:hypothetical protein
MGILVAFSGHPEFRRFFCIALSYAAGVEGSSSSSSSADLHIHI